MRELQGTGEGMAEANHPIDKVRALQRALYVAAKQQRQRRFHGPDCCLRPKAQGSARSVPHGLFFRRGRVHLRCGLQLRFSSLQRSALA